MNDTISTEGDLSSELDHADMLLQIAAFIEPSFHSDSAWTGSVLEAVRAVQAERDFLLKLRSLPSVATLVWVGDDYGAYQAQTPFGAYETWPIGGSFWKLTFNQVPVEGACLSFEVAQVLAQSDYERRVLACRQEPTSDDAAAEAPSWTSDDLTDAFIRLSEVIGTRASERSHVDRISCDAGQGTSESEPKAVVSTMRLSDGREDHYVMLHCADRTLSIRMYPQKGRTDYEAAELNWLLAGGEKPFILDFDTDTISGTQPEHAVA